MSDNLKSRSGRDRQRVAAGQDWEINYMKDKFNVSSQQVAGAVRAVGNSRKKIEEYLSNKNAHAKVI